MHIPRLKHGPEGEPFFEEWVPVYSLLSTTVPLQHRSRTPRAVSKANVRIRTVSSRDGRLPYYLPPADPVDISPGLADSVFRPYTGKQQGLFAHFFAKL